jgi:hypothetical protein
LVLQKSKSRTAMRQAQFPIFSNLKEFKKHRTVRYLADIFGESSCEFSAIRASQPFENCPSAPTEDGLWLLGGHSRDGLCTSQLSADSSRMFPTPRNYIHFVSVTHCLGVS